MSAIPASLKPITHPFLLAFGAPAAAAADAENWQPEGSSEGDDVRFIWSVVAVTTRGELVYQRVSASNHREAVSAAQREIANVARIVGASPVSL